MAGMDKAEASAYVSRKCVAVCPVVPLLENIEPFIFMHECIKDN